MPEKRDKEAPSYKHVLIVTLVSGAVPALLIAAIIGHYGWNPTAALLIGEKETFFSPKLFPKGTVVYRDSFGYDGAAYYRVAMDPLLTNPDICASYKRRENFLRYQRVLYPLLVWLLAFGNPKTIPWMMLLLNVSGTAAIGGILAKWLEAQKSSPYLALIASLNPGLLFACVYGLLSPMALVFATIGVVFYLRKSYVGATITMALALLTRESSILFLGPLILDRLYRKDWRAAVLLCTAVTPVVLYQLRLIAILGGKVGGASSFVFALPLSGMIAKLENISFHASPVRVIRDVSPVLMMIFVLVGCCVGLWSWWKSRSVFALLLAAQAGFMLFTYHDFWSTFVNATRVNAGTFIPAVFLQAESPSRGTKFLLGLSVVMSIAAAARILMDAAKPFYLL